MCAGVLGVVRGHLNLTVGRVCRVQCVLLRSSQPSGQSTAPKRSRADESLLNVHLGRSKKGFIVDTWGTGRGSGRPEPDLHYPQWRKITRPITVQSIVGAGSSGGMPHIGATLEALSRLVDACNDTACTTDRWLGKLDASGWLTLVLNTLNTACVVAQCLHQEGSPVLVNGGLSGRDTPLLVTSLAQIILSPDCRTVRGLEALIEREWIQAGFPFTTRHRRSAYASGQLRGGQPVDADADGSTFVLFLDCVHQLHRQFPCSFEFDAELLVVLFEHSFASQYGTFLADSERERAALRLHQRTTSLWSYLNRPNVLQTLLNPCYVPNQEVIWPSVAPISLELWSGESGGERSGAPKWLYCILYAPCRFVPALGDRPESLEGHHEADPDAGDARKRAASGGERGQTRCVDYRQNHSYLFGSLFRRCACARSCSTWRPSSTMPCCPDSWPTARWTSRTAAAAVAALWSRALRMAAAAVAASAASAVRTAAWTGAARAAAWAAAAAR